MTEEKVFFQAGELKIEGLLNNLNGDRAMLVTHPHPLYGGDMYNNVVDSVVNAYCKKGYSTLRFNFRGIGQSQGNHEQGTGEQEDVKGALSYLSSLGKSSIDLVGYSFGAWVNAQGLDGFVNVDRVIMVSPPVGFIDFLFLGYSPGIKLVIAGSEDDIAPPAMIREMLPSWNPDASLKIIEGADHFYGGKLKELIDIIQNFLN